MKVLMTADAVGGVWTYAIDLCRALQPFDVHVVLATMGPEPSESQQETAAGVRNVKLVSVPWKLEWMEQPWDDVARAGEWLMAIADRESIDLVHLNGYSHAQLKWKRPVIVVAHSCVCSWWQAVHGTCAPAQWDRYRLNVAAGLAAADRVVAPTHAFLRTLQAHYGALPRTAVIHNARSMPQQSADRERLPAIFACGRAWDAAKNLQLLERAGRELPWNIYVAGPAMSPDGCTHRLRSVQALGTLTTTQIERWLSRAAVFVHPAVYEPFGLAVLEAALQGCALVLSDVPTLRELWDDAALFASPRDSGDFRAQLAFLIEHPRERAALGRAARQRAAEFQPGAMAGSYHSLYADVIRTHRTKELAVA